jgi:hypothetical protein
VKKSPQKPAQQQLLEIYQIDLVPSGTAFALNKPVLQGNVYVFRSWPENTPARLSVQGRQDQAADEGPEPGSRLSAGPGPVGPHDLAR